MTTSELFATLRGLDVALWVEGDRLRYSAPKGALDGTLRGELARRREEIVALLRAAQGGAAGDVPPIETFPRGGPLPLSWGQEQLWFLDQLAPGNAAYNLPAAVALEGALDIAALVRSFGEIVRRHEALRTTFAAVDGRPVQVVAAPRRVRVALPLVDLAGLGVGAAAEARRLADGEARRPFALDRDPLLRVVLLRLGAGAHRLLVTLHHAVADNWSQGVLIRELAVLYGAFAAGRPAALPPLPVQYADFALWQRRWLAGEVRLRQLSFWRQRLAGLPDLDLPTDRPRPPEQGFRGRTRAFSLPRSLTDLVHAFRHGRGVTPFMTLLAAFQALLSRCSGQRDFGVGFPVAGRRRHELEGLIGYFVNALVARGDLAGDPTFDELVERVRATTVEAYGHQDLPFGQLVEELAPARDRSRSPLFQVMLSLQESRLEGCRLPGLVLAPLEVDAGTARLDLTLTFEERRGELHGWLEYNRDLFDATTIGRLLAHFERLLAALVSAPGRRLGEVSLLGPRQRQQVLVEWNATDLPFAADRCLDQLLFEGAARSPEAVAVSCESEQVSYRRLARQGAGVARRLRRLGVGPEARVGVSLGRSAELPAALLGVMGAGGAYVPLDPALPPERRARLLAEAAVTALLSDEAPGSGRGTETAAPVLAMGSLAPSEAAAPPPRPSWPETLAYVLYTSGSTGRPKGVAVTHRGLVNFLAALTRQPGFTADDRLLAVTSLAFDIAAVELYLPLLVGGRVELARAETAADGGRLRWWLAASGATGLQATPATWRMLLAAGWQRQPRFAVLCGGEALPAELAAGLADRGGAIWNFYGPTETTVWSALERIEPGGPVTLGRPLANTAIRVLDRRLLPLSPGAVGELVIGGAGLARGYLGRPGRTAEAFVPDPFSGDPGARLYRTGDLGRHRVDGRLEFLGRRDHQLKVRGFRIEAGEVEAALEAHPKVREAVAVAREAAPGDRRLVAYIVPRGQREPAVDELRSFLATTLPEYMLPSAFVVLEALPLTPNRKVDRRALPAPEWTPRRGYAPPRTPAEEVLATIWAEVLGIERVGIDDGFFDLGGHSLLATQVVSRIRSAFGVELAVRRLFARPTVAGMAVEVAASARAGAPSPAARPLAAAEETLSFSQLRQWFLVQFEPDSPAYNLVHGVRLSGRLAVEALAASLAEVVRRHQVLRTTFHADGGEPVQRVAPAWRPPLPLVDLGVLAPREREGEARRLARRLGRRPFDLARIPLLRMLLVRLAEGEHQLLVAVHHIVFDGWSGGVLIREVTTLYEALAAGRPSPLPELPIQYADFARWQRHWLAGDALEEQLAYWRQRLADAPPELPLPVDRPRPAVRTSRGACEPLTLPAALVRSLRRLGAASGASPFMVLLAALQALLARYASQLDVSVGTFIANRNRPEIEGLIGFFVNTLVLRTDLAGDPAFGELVRRVREVTLGAYAHQDLPFEKLLEELHPGRQMSSSPLFQVMLVLQNMPMPPLELPGLTASPLELEAAEWAHFDWTLWLLPRGEALDGHLDYNPDLYDRSTVVRLLGHWRNLLAAAVARPELRLGELPLLDGAERHQAVREWTGGDGPRPPSPAVHRLIAARAEERPDAVAVVAGEEVLSFGDLDRQAGGLARRLRDRGVGPEVLVGLGAERRPEALVALLGILRAGGAFLPLNPDDPPERLAWMVADSGTSLVLADGEAAAKLAPVPARVVALTPPRRGTEPGVVAAPGNLAYVIYTSGSTGRPKGVQVSQQALATYAWTASGVYGLGPSDRTLQFSPLSFDAAIDQTLCPLVRGAAVVLRSEAMLGSLAAFADGCGRWRVTAMDLPTAYWHLLAAGLTAEEWGKLRSLRLISIGGEAAQPEALAAWWRGAGGRVRLVNTYGPTEATVVATVADLSTPEAPLAAARRVPIGRPLPGVRAYAVDPWLRPLPAGVAGELCLGGAGLARGYLGRPALTAERFIPDGLSQRPGERLYRTGDRVRRLPDGRLECLGRSDRQVKVRGFRVEPGEVEGVLRQHPGVREAVVVARDLGGGEPGLVAYAVPAAVAPAGSELRRHLEERLPAFMVPAALVLLEALPLTANGKVDRGRLPAPERQGAAAAPAGAAPRGPVEAVVAEIWAAALGLPRVGIHDDFFALGGHSLLATQVLSRLRQTLGVEVPLRTLFAGPTVAEVAAAVAAVQGPAPPALPAPVSRQGPLPLSFAQQRLWFIEQFEPGSPAYHIAVALEVTGRPDPAALAACLRQVVRRHETLRTTFCDVGGEPRQQIAPRLTVAMPVVDLSTLATEVGREVARELARREARRPFDLARGPLVRATLLRLERDEHRLLFTLHHVVSDAWSLGVLVREVGALYRASLAGQGSPLRMLPFQYADYAAWQRSWLAGDVLESQLAYWRRQLAAAPAVLELPADRPRSPVRSLRGALLTFSPPAALEAGLRRLSAERGATLFMTALAGFFALLGRHSGRRDLLVGSPIAGRSRAEWEELIGFFVNTLVLRGDLAGDPTFAELLARVRETALGAYAHQDLPFERLVEELEPSRDRSRTPLFQVMFVVQNAPFEGLELPGLALRQEVLDTGTAKFDLVLTIEAGPAGLRGTLEYATDLFDRTTMRRLVGHYLTLLAGAAADPWRRLSDLPLLNAGEGQQLAREWNHREAVAPAPASLPRLFEAQATRRPEAVAVVDGGEALSYGQLDARANRLARRLGRLGVAKEAPVGLATGRSAEAVVGILGILKAGAAYLPIDSSYPPERLAYMLADSGARLLVARESELTRLPPEVSAARVIGCDGDLRDPAEDGAAGVAVSPGPDDLAYVIYTSGSTGKPKGTLIRHRHAVRLFTSTEGWFGFGRDDVWTLFHSYAFDFSVWEIWGALLYGGRLVVVPYLVSRSPEAFYRLLVDERVTVLNQTPSAFRQLVAAEPAAAVGDLALRLVIFGGEALELASLAPWFERHGDERPRLVNMYGITETTVHVTYRPLGRRDVERAHVSPVGRPLPDLAVHLLDAAGRPAPIGVPGELCVGGAGVGGGYLGRPGLTAARFVPDPFAGAGARLYRSGDLARHGADGDLHYLGRIDQQVQLRGFRVELGEIEAVLASHPAVRQAAVVAREETPGDLRLVAYAVPAAAGAVRRQASELRRHLAVRLPDYMVPGRFVELESLPLTPSGKVDRRALAARADAATEGAAVGDYLAPRDPVEEAVAGIWAETLGLARVGARDDFFALGGHSLLASRVVSRLRRVFEVDLPVARLFAAPTVAELAREVAVARSQGPARPAPSPTRLARSGEIPVSVAQQRLWFIDRLAPGSPVYNIPAAVDVGGRLDVARLRRSLVRVVARHEALRTTFSERGGQPVAETSPAAATHPAAALPVVDLGGLAPARREACTRSLAECAARRSFDLARGPLLRAVVLRRSPAEHRVVLTVHHIVADGWSMGILVRELGAFYRQGAAARPEPALPELPIQYADHAAWQRGELSGELPEAHLAYWRQQLAGIPPALDLPTDRPRPPVQSLRGEIFSFALGERLSEALSGLGREEGTTLFMTLLAGLYTLLGHYTGSVDLAVGSPIAGRSLPEVEGLIGLFVNSLVLRGDLTGDPPFAHLLGRVREMALASYDHQEVPFERLVEELDPRRDLSRTPLFQVLFVLQNAPFEPLDLPGLACEVTTVSSGTARTDLTLSMVETGRGLAGTLEYATDLFDATTVQRLTGHLRNLLAAAVGTPRRRLSELPLLSSAEGQELLREWNDTGPPPAAPDELHRRVAAQAGRTPEAVALAAGGEQLSYGELARRSTAAAGRLQALGVGPEVLVAVALDRRPELVVTLLAILEAGGAYLPLDPAYPAERLAFMLADAQAAVVVTRRDLVGRFARAVGSRARVLCVDGPEEESPAPRPAPAVAAAGSGNLAYVLYTSGSTGRPKGVAIEHRSAVALLRWAAGVFPPESLTGVLAATSVCFDLSVFELFFPLSAGGRVILVESVLALHGLPAAGGVTLVNTVPSAMAELVRQEALPSSLVVANLAGEPLPAPLVAAIHRRVPRAAVYNLYGPSEDTTYSTFGRPGVGGVPSIGRPITGTRAHVLDQALAPQPVGVAGELYLGGAGLARGYLGRPALTAERFLPDPFSREVGARLYRTGDRVRTLAGGELEFLGRLDHQVKVRGFRIELGEVEAGLAAHPEVEEAVVAAREQSPGDLRLVAWVVPAAGASLAGRAGELRRHLAARLPGYMVPASFAEVAALPRTPSGKVDRRALPPPEEDELSRLRPRRLPASPVEEALVEIFAQVLGRPEVGVDDDFFELGGHSLLLVQVGSRLRDRFGLELPLPALFGARTVAAMAVLVEERLFEVVESLSDEEVGVLL